MPPSRLISNSPRKRVQYVLKTLPTVALDTAKLSATLFEVDPEFDFLRAGSDAVALAFPDGPPHPDEILIPWIAQELRRAEKDDETSGGSRYRSLYDEIGAQLVPLATWARATRPDLTRTRAREAIRSALNYKAPTPDQTQGEIVYKFDDGWTIQKLTSPESIFFDGKYVQNCLKETESGPGYAAKVAAGRIHLFSLRNHLGKPLVSMEYNIAEKRFNQIFGKQNTPIGSSLAAVRSRIKTGARELWESLQESKPKVQEFLQALRASPQDFVKSDVRLPDSATTLTGEFVLAGYGHPLPSNLREVQGNLDLRGYEYPLPPGLQTVSGTLVVIGYDFPLPQNLTNIGSISFNGYKHPLPTDLTDLSGYSDLRDYPYPLPQGITQVRGGIILSSRYVHPLPSGIAVISGEVETRDWKFPLPGSLRRIGGTVTLSAKYKNLLPSGLESIGGSLFLGGYELPLPDSLRVIGGSIDLANYVQPLPSNLVEVGRDLSAEQYTFPLPQNLRTVGGTLNLDNYGHPLPDSLTAAGALVLYRYKFPLPQGLRVRRGIEGAARYSYPLPPSGLDAEAMGALLEKFRTLTPNATAQRRTSRRLRKTSRQSLSSGSKFGVPPPELGGGLYPGKWTLVGSRRLGIPTKTSDIDYMVQLEDVWPRIHEFQPYEGVEGAYWKPMPGSDPESTIVAVPSWAYDIIDKSYGQAAERHTPRQLRALRKKAGKDGFYRAIGVAYTSDTLAPYSMLQKKTRSRSKTSRRARRTSRK